MGQEPSRTETASVLAWLQFVGAELRELRREMLQDRLERQQSRVGDLERELEQVRLERQQGEELQRSQAQEMQSLEQRLRDPAVPAEERAQLEAFRAEISTRGPAVHSTALQKEAQITDRLRHEQVRLQSLLQLERLLTPPTNTGSN
jgi:predicted nuclease with TOPRIM domain